MVLVILLYALFGFSFTIGKFILQYSQPFFAVGARMTISGILLLGYMYLGHWYGMYPRKKDLKYFVQLIFFNIFLPYTLRLWALQYIPASKASLLFILSPFFTALFAYFFLRERLSLIKVLGLCIGFSGMIPILATGGSEEGVNGLGFISIPELAIILGVASMSYSLIIIQKLVKHKETPPYLVNGISMFYGGLLALGASSAFESNLFVQQQEPVIKQGILPLIGILSLQILISNILCQNLRASLLKHYSSTFMSFSSFLGPVFTSIYGYFLFGEEITWQFLASFSIVLAGLSIYHYDDHMENQNNHIQSAKK